MNYPVPPPPPPHGPTFASPLEALRNELYRTRSLYNIANKEAKSWIRYRDKYGVKILELDRQIAQLTRAPKAPHHVG